MLHHLFTRLKGVDILLFDNDGRNKGLEQLHIEKRKQSSIEFPKSVDPGQFFFFSLIIIYLIYSGVTHLLEKILQSSYPPQ